MLVIGLTGSIGAGKTTVAAMFAEAGVPVFDADRAVHDLYSGRAAPLVEAAFPGTAGDGTVDRARLAARLRDDPSGFPKLEAIVHPLVREEEAAFIAAQRARGARIVLLDLPLLVEQGSARRVDCVVLVEAPEAVRRERVLARPGMSEEKFRMLAARQAGDAEKRGHAHFVIDTSGPLEATRRAVADVLKALAATAAAR